MIKYLGSKRLLIPTIVNIVRQVDGGVSSVLDLFSGTSRVGYAMKELGLQVFSNDYSHYAEMLARCYIEADKEDVLKEATELINECNSIKGEPGYFTKTFCERSRFFQPKNGERIDAIREFIASSALSGELLAVLLTSLMEAADRVDSTVGLQMAYLKKWSPRSYNDLHMRVPQLLPKATSGKGKAYRLDALEAAAKIHADIVYLDPPYNQHSYLGNYHIWESLVLWDKPDVYGVACKRVDTRENKSVFNSRKSSFNALKAVLEALTCDIIVLSFSNEGFLLKESIEEFLFSLWGGAGHVFVIEQDFSRYVGAKIGIYNPEGQKVGKVKNIKNKEYIFIASKRKLNL